MSVINHWIILFRLFGSVGGQTFVLIIHGKTTFPSK